MLREIKTKEEIREMLQAEAARYPDCKTTYFGGLYWHEPDETGCNWQVSVMSGRDPGACYDHMHDFAVRLRASFNIPDEG